MTDESELLRCVPQKCDVLLTKSRWGVSSQSNEQQRAFLINVNRFLSRALEICSDEYVRDRFVLQESFSYALVLNSCVDSDLSVALFHEGGLKRRRWMRWNEGGSWRRKARPQPVR